jgi:hypothetical protein
MLVLDCTCRIINAYQEDVLGDAASGHTTSRIDSIHGSFPLVSSSATVYGDVSNDKLHAVRTDQPPSPRSPAIWTSSSNSASSSRGSGYVHSMTSCLKFSNARRTRFMARATGGEGERTESPMDQAKLTLLGKTTGLYAIGKQTGSSFQGEASMIVRKTRSRSRAERASGPMVERIASRPGSVVSTSCREPQ